MVETPFEVKVKEMLCTVLVQSYLYNLIELYKTKKKTLDATWAEEETVRGGLLHTLTQSSCKGCASIRL